MDEGTTVNGSRGGRRIGAAFTALRHRNYRLFFIGQCVSLIGTWMQSIGQSWLVLTLTEGQPDAPFKLGLVTALQFLPMLLFALFAGTFVDRFPKRRVLLVTQSILAVLAVALATLTLTDAVRYWHICALAVLLGLVNTIDMPTRQAFFVEMVGREDLMNAIGLNSTIFNLARIVGPAIAGSLIGLIGIAPCFYLNAASFLAVIAGLAMMRLPDAPVRKSEARTFRGVAAEAAEGLAYVRRNPELLYPLLLLAVVNVFVINFSVMIPLFATQRLGQDATGYGLLMTSLGLGSFLGALRIAATSRKGPSRVVLFGGAAGTSVLVAVAGFQTVYAVACAVLVAVGFFTISFVTTVNTTVQLATEDRMRGRVMSLYTLVFGGFTPFGSLYAGKFTELAGVTGCMAASGAIGLAGTLAVLLLLRRSARRPQAVASEPPLP